MNCYTIVCRENTQPIYPLSQGPAHKYHISNVRLFNGIYFILYLLLSLAIKAWLGLVGRTSAGPPPPSGYSEQVRTR